ncbi:hypothetical protein NLJ89_g724 [Agrocybe chaxingu]|uniref:Uncharacterized protein n=1 Tax=Agrocybe chaxingu TaxID=84603 RepID=A0A9W8N1C5_9AGAR|nr:hypothetical protein NLJ89_g724 [Agrocybe chaxingu]
MATQLDQATQHRYPPTSTTQNDVIIDVLPAAEETVFDGGSGLLSVKWSYSRLFCFGCVFVGLTGTLIDLFESEASTVKVVGFVAALFGTTLFIHSLIEPRRPTAYRWWFHVDRTEQVGLFIAYIAYATPMAGVAATSIFLVNAWIYGFEYAFAHSLSGAGPRAQVITVHAPPSLLCFGATIALGKMYQFLQARVNRASKRPRHRHNWIYFFSTVVFTGGAYVALLLFVVAKDVRALKFGDSFHAMIFELLYRLLPDYQAL